MSKITRRTALKTAAALVAAPTFISSAKAAAKAPVLIELFTSQGCSSCPAADKVAGELRKRNDVVVVSMNVDYWDYLGWRDTLAKKDYTKRQYDYANQRGDGRVYTPQMIFNGRDHAVGSNRNEIDYAIEAAIQNQPLLPLALSATEQDIIVEIPDGAKGDGTLWLMAIMPEVTVNVERGENRGSKLVYNNVVANLVPAGMWHGGSEKLMLPRKAIMTKGCKLCVAVLQEGMTGKVLGTGTWSTPQA